MAELYNEGLFRKGLVRTSGLVRPDLLLTFDDIFSPYAIDRLEAALALDFNNNVYRTGNKYTTFADAFTGTSPKLTYSTAAGSNSTMVNSAGNIVWAPHNLVRYSENPSDWNTDDVTLTTSGVSDPNGGTNAATFTLSNAASPHASYDNLGAGYSGLWMKVGVYLKVGSGTRYFAVGHWQGASDNCGAGFDLEAGVVTGTGGIGTDQTARNGAIQDLGNGWFYCSVEVNFPTATFYPAVFARTTSYTSGSIFESWTPAGTETYSIYGLHSHRSDLGGMAQVPQSATGFETYVPTNGSAEYLPRVGHHVYNGSTWVNEGLLIESEPRTNLVTHSEDFSDASWATYQATDTANSTTAPDGTTTGTLLAADIANDVHRIQRSSGATTIASINHTFSVFVKAGTHDYVTIGFYGPSEEFVAATFDLTSGTTATETDVGTTSGTIALTSKEDMGGGWFKLSLTGSHGGTSSLSFICFADGAAGNAYTNFGQPVVNAAGTETIEIWGAQLEQGSTPSSYMPTYGGTYTRTAQSLEVPAHWYDADNPTPTGPELVTNGGFATDTDWIKGANATISGGLLTYAGGSGNGDTSQSSTMQVGQAYLVSFEITERSAGSVKVREASTSGGTSQTAVGTHSYVIVAEGTDRQIIVDVSSTFVGSIDNVSVRQVSAPQFGWPEPEYIGPELIVDGSGNWVGDFDVAADVSEWTAGLGGSASHTGTAMELTVGASTLCRIEKPYTFSSNKVYKLTFEITSTSAGVSRVYNYSADELHNFGTGNTAGTFEHVFTGGSSTRGFDIRIEGTEGSTATIDNISVREINPLSVSIQMDGRMTYADQNAALNVIWWRWYAGAANDILAYYATDGAYDRSKFTQGSIVEQNTSNDSRYLFSPGINVPFNVAARHGSTFVNGAVDGTALPGDTTPVALPDLSGTNLQIAHDFMGTIGTFRQFAGDIGDTGLVTATNPSTEPTLSLTFDGTGGSYYNLSWSE